MKKAQTSRSQANPLELIREHQRKKVVTNHTTSTRVNEQQNTNQTVQNDYDRNEQSQSNSQRDYQRSTKSNSPTPRPTRRKPQQPTRKSRVEPPKLKTRVEQLSEGISSFVEQEEAERLAKNLESLNQHLTDSLLSTGRTKKLRNSVERINRRIADYSQKQYRRRGIETLRDYLEESILESDPEVINAIEQLSQLLESQFSSTINNLRQLQETINSYTHKLQQQHTLTSTAEELAQGITNYSEQIEVEESTPSVTQLNTQLQEYVSNHSTTALENLHYSLIQEQIMQNLDQVNPDEREMLKLKTAKIAEKIKVLETKHQANKQKQQARTRDYLKKQLINIKDYTQLSTGQTVTVDEKNRHNYRFKAFSWRYARSLDTMEWFFCTNSRATKPSETGYSRTPSTYPRTK